MIPIKGAVSFETAHYIDDYPAGFTARVHKKMWIETKKGKGQRGVYATTSKHNDSKWCAPKANTYDELCGIAIIEVSDVVPSGKWTADDIGHAVWVRAGNGGDVAFLERYNAMFGPFVTEYERATMINELAMARANVTLKQWKEEHPAPKWEIHMTPAEEQARHDWDRERAVFLKARFLAEVARIKANDEVPEPTTVAPAQEAVPAGAMF